MVPQATLDAWYTGRPVPELPYPLNASVRILAGPHAGSLAAVISPVTLLPEPVYLVELASSGMDLQLPASALSPAASSP